MRPWQCVQGIVGWLGLGRFGEFSHQQLFSAILVAAQGTVGLEQSLDIISRRVLNVLKLCRRSGSNMFQQCLCNVWCIQYRLVILPASGWCLSWCVNSAIAPNGWNIMVCHRTLFRSDRGWETFKQDQDMRRAWSSWVNTRPNTNITLWTGKFFQFLPE